MDFKENLKLLFKAKIDCIWINSYEEKHILNEIFDLLRSEFPTMKMSSYSFFEGIKEYNLLDPSRSEIKPLSPDALFRSIIDAQTKGKIDIKDGIKSKKDTANEVFILKDFHLLTDTKPMVRAIRDTKEKTPEEMMSYCPIIIISPIISIPLEHDKLFHVIEYKLPDDEKIDLIFNSYRQLLESKGIKIDENEFIKSKYYARGLTIDQIKNTLSLSVVDKSNISSDIFYQSRLDLIKKTGVLKLEECHMSLDDMGGNHAFKDWIDDIKLTFDDEAEDFGVDKSKGFLALGIPGTAKTLSAEMISSELDIPLLKFDMSKVNEKNA